MITVVEKVRFYETDMMGIAHHSNHIRWFECGRCEYLAVGRSGGLCQGENTDYEPVQFHYHGEPDETGIAAQ